MSDSGWDAAALRHLSRRLSWLLRHAAQQEGLLPDEQGYVRLDDVLRLLRRGQRGVGRDEVLAVVQTVDPHKQRFSLDTGPQGDWIRANYGHSLSERVSHPVAQPPPCLYHGTTAAVLDTILQEGLRPMQRQYVHLSTDPVLALQVGARRGPAVLLAVDTALAGVPFYRANPLFWLADSLPAACLCLAPVNAWTAAR